MAGIGFELKKLFNKKGFLMNIRAYMYASLITVGPFLLCTIMITLLQVFLSFTRIGFSEKQLFLAATVYAFVFSQIITSGFSMIIIRYISDQLYCKTYDKVLPSLYGVITLCLLLGAIVGGTFYIISPLSSFFKLPAFILFMELIVLWLETVYLSALKNYLKIILGFLLGTITTLLCGYILLKYFTISYSISMLLSLDIGFFVIITTLMFYIESFFTEKDTRYFLFLTYLDKYPALFAINFCYTLAIYIHNFIFWKSNLGEFIGNTYTYAPLYDVAIFYAYLTIIPSMVIFVVSIETSFYDKYKSYYSLITGGGNLADIHRSRQDMTKVLWNEIIHVMEVQLFFSLIFLVIGNTFLPYIGVTGLSLDIYDVAVLGAYCNAIFLIVLLILLYFEDRKGALITTVIFLFANVTLTILSIKMGEIYYGIGLFLSSLIALILSIIRLSYFLKNIDYYTFCSQPVIYKEKKGVFSALVEKIYRCRKPK